MKIRFSRRQGMVIIILILVALGVSSYLINQGFESNIRSHEMIRLAKEHQNNKEYLSSTYWYVTAYSRALISGARWEVFKVYNDRIHKLREQENLSAALDTCWQAAKIWNQEDSVNLLCSSIEQELSNQQ